MIKNGIRFRSHEYGEEKWYTLKKIKSQFTLIFHRLGR
jgi:hypothetical protein